MYQVDFIASMKTHGLNGPVNKLSIFQKNFYNQRGCECPSCGVVFPSLPLNQIMDDEKVRILQQIGARQSAQNTISSSSNNPPSKGTLVSSIGICMDCNGSQDSCNPSTREIILPQTSVGCLAALISSVCLFTQRSH